MNVTGLKNYLQNEASDEEFLNLARAYCEANRYDDFRLYDSLDDIVQAAGWDAEQLAWQLEDVDTSADYFRFDGQGNLESISQADLVEQSMDYYLDAICNWVEDAPGYEYQNFSFEVRDFIDQEDPHELLSNLSIEVEVTNTLLLLALKWGRKHSPSFAIPIKVFIPLVQS